MKTTILEELNLPESVSAALSRESLRTGKPVNVLIAEWVISKAQRLVGGGTPPTPPLHGPHGRRHEMAA